MAIGFNDVTVGDDFTSAATIEGQFLSGGGYATIASNDVVVELQGDQRFRAGAWGSPIHVPTGSLQIMPGTTAIRFKNFTAGAPATVSCWIFGKDEPTVIVGSTGQATKVGVASLNFQHNDVAVATENTADFEDGTVAGKANIVWTLTDDAANTRVKISAVLTNVSEYRHYLSGDGSYQWLDKVQALSGNVVNRDLSIIYSAMTLVEFDATIGGSIRSISAPNDGLNAGQLVALSNDSAGGDVTLIDSATGLPAGQFPLWCGGQNLVLHGGTQSDAAIFMFDGSTWIIVATFKSSTDIQLFDANGTWTKPLLAKTVRVIAYGGGGGGGGGSNNGTGTVHRGGAGGGGASHVDASFSASELPATVAVTIGGGGNAGNGAAASSNASGTSGGVGGSSTFGAILQAPGGGGGGGGGASAAPGGGGAGIGVAGGTATANSGTVGAGGGPGGATATSTDNAGFGGASGGVAGSGGGNAAYGGAGGGSGGAGNAGDPGGGGSMFGGGGGGGGGGATGAGGTANGDPGGATNAATPGGGGAGGTSGGAPTVGTAGTNASATGYEAGAGGGGGGGTTTAAVAGAVGGAGGIPGGGGGGGGCGCTTGAGAAGGVGGRGRIIVISS